MLNDDDCEIHITVVINVKINVKIKITSIINQVLY